jgi:hypothetical protein
VLDPTRPRPSIWLEPVQVAAVARVPPSRLQLMVAPEWVVEVGGGGMDVPGLVEGGWLGWVYWWVELGGGDQIGGR